MRLSVQIEGDAVPTVVNAELTPEGDVRLVVAGTKIEPEGPAGSAAMVTVPWAVWDRFVQHIEKLHRDQHGDRIAQEAKRTAHAPASVPPTADPAPRRNEYPGYREIAQPTENRLADQSHANPARSTFRGDVPGQSRLD